MPKKYSKRVSSAVKMPRKLQRLSLNLLLFACMVHISCFPSAPIESRLAEMGGINPTDFGLGLAKDQIRLSVVRLCLQGTFRQCASAVSITDDGYFLSAKHVFQNAGIDLKGPDFNRQTVEPIPLRYFVVTGFESHLGYPVEPESFEVELVQYGESMFDSLSNINDLDIVVLRLKNRSPANIKRLNQWVMPARISFKLPSKGERVFSAGYSWPKYSPGVFELAFKNYEEFYRREYGGNPPPRPDVTVANFGLYISRGFADAGVDSKGISVSTNDLFSQSLFGFDNLGVTPEDQVIPFSGWDSLDLIAGSSGGAWLDKSGAVSGILYANNKRTHKWEDESFEDVPSRLAKAVSMNAIEKYFKITELKINTNSYDRDQEERIKRQKILYQEMKKKVDGLKRYMDTAGKKLIGKKFYLKNKTLPDSYNKPPPENPHTQHPSKIGSFWNQTDCVTGSLVSELRKERFNLHTIQEVEVDFRTLTDTFIRYRSDLAPKGKDGLNQWSPYFNVHTAKVLGDVTYSNPFNMTRKGERLRGYTPFFMGKDEFEFGFYDELNANMISSFLTHLIAQTDPETPANDGRSRWFWTILRCKGS